MTPSFQTLKPPHAIAKLLNDLRLKSYRFDQANPDPATKAANPTLAKLLVRKRQTAAELPLSSLNSSAGTVSRYRCA